MVSLKAYRYGLNITDNTQNNTLNQLNISSNAKQHSKIKEAHSIQEELKTIEHKPREPLDTGLAEAIKAREKVKITKYETPTKKRK